MQFYPPKINNRFHAPKYSGKAGSANASGTDASFVCGAFVRFSLRIDAKTKEILEAKFKSNGCGFLVAAADVLAEKVSGKKLTELHGLDENELRAEIEAELETFPENRRHCAKICLDALHRAFSEFRAFQIEEFAGEKALICTCFGVSEETIEKVIAENSLQNVEEVTDACNAGGGCGSCRFLIQEIIDSRIYR
ncbi:MAG: iron-sulfur cluster assembly scaffold protein [Pyrinomonadaceae bacterium]